jgi:hypothetical protein
LFAAIALAFRTLRKNLSLTITALLAISLGIGANTVLVSVVEGVLLRPLDCRVIARLKPGVTLAAKQDMARVTAQFRRQFGKNAIADNESVGLIEYREWLTRGIRLPLLILLAAVGLVLLIDCANVRPSRTVKKRIEYCYDKTYPCFPHCMFVNRPYGFRCHQNLDRQDHGQHVR